MNIGIYFHIPDFPQLVIKIHPAKQIKTAV